MSGKPDGIFIDPKTFKYINEMLNKASTWIDELHLKQAKFMKMFHKGVKLRHKGSGVEWTIIDTYQHSATGEVRAIITSEKGYEKHLKMEQCTQFDLIYIPEAVQVLFGEEDRDPK